jgi:beta-glucosidase
MTHDQQGRPWADPSLPVAERVELLLAEMTLAEKVGQTHQVANLHPHDDVSS